MNYGQIPVLYRAMYEGYSILSIDYGCVFDGKHVDERCDYGIEISTEQVLLPKRIKTFPSGGRGGGGEHYWVRRDGFLKFLDSLRSTK